MHQERLGPNEGMQVREERGQVSSRVASRGRKDFVDGLISAGAAGIALLVPFVILLIAMPVALTVRGLLEVTGWLFGIDVR